MTPPPSGPASSSGGRRLASPKRQRLYSPEVEDDGAMREESPGRTPRSIQSAPLEHRPIPMRRISNVPSLPPSQSSYASYTAPSHPPSEGSSPTRGRRSPVRSPAKNSNSLRAMDVPVVSVPLGNSPLDVLPSDVHGLFQSIQDIAGERECFIPSEIKQDIYDIIPHAKNRWFMPPNDVSIPTNSHIRPRTRKPRSPTDIAIAELDTLRDIEEKARDCKLRECAECTWNSRVHDPLLLHALSGHETVHVEPSQVARIASPFVPSTSGRGGGSVIESKIIDYSLTIWLNRGVPDPIQEHVPGPDARLMKAIARRVWSQPSDSQTFNHTLYSPLQFCPIACNIETKSAASTRDGQLQLSVWTAAWYRRMQKLLPEESPMVTLPLIQVMAHNWTLSFAVHRGTSIEIVGEYDIGNTANLMGIYQVNAVLRKIADWIATSYRAWLEGVLLNDSQT
ncbi:Methyltransferase type 11 [Fusarium albosuccineum]|uniref:Methyltransferase type 11 n=1 Tax=Fusarium albosuccineum TaxID=1237068 RepID=A0A8H4L5G2_9HYPO|nr:Methyltransferase type 11 [Fusarium albosuccineum]